MIPDRSHAKCHACEASPVCGNKNFRLFHAVSDSYIQCMTNNPDIVSIICNLFYCGYLPLQKFTLEAA